MKHIGFDDSTVLSEFARIAHDNKLLKTAVGEQADILGKRPIVPETPEQKKQREFKEMIGKGKPTVMPAGQPGLKDIKISPVAPKQVIQPRQTAPSAPQILKQVTPIETKRTAPSVPMAPKKDLPVSSNPLVVQTQRLNSLFANLMKEHGGDQIKVRPIYDAEIAKTVDTLKKQFGEHPEIVKFEATVKGIGTPKNASNEEPDLSKNAEGALYDVSGETGEQLIDSAHPGGTKTELSHSKTDENLVETIVEQQKKDIEVAQSVPKGTYATLVNLYNTLQKMGHEGYLNDLVNTISKIATPENVILYNLTSLADRLDKCGAKEAADKVDLISVALLPPSIVMPTAVPAAAMIAAPFALHAIFKDLTSFEGTLDNLINRLGDLDPNENARGIVNAWISRLTQGKQVLRILPTTTDPAERAQMLEQKQAQVDDLSNYIDQMVIQWPQVKSNLTDWGFDAQQAEKTLLSTQRSIKGQTARIVQKIETAKSAPEVAPVDSALVKTPEEKPIKKKWDPLNILQHARIFRRRFNRAVRDLDEQHYNAISRFRAEDIGKFPNQLKSEIRNAISMVRDAGGWSKFEKDMNEQRSIAGKGEAKPEGIKEPEPQGAKGIPMTAPEGEGGFMKKEYVRNQIVDKIMKKLGLRAVQFKNIATFYNLALNTARRNLEKQNLTSDADGQRRLESFLTRITNHPRLEETIQKYLK